MRHWVFAVMVACMVAAIACSASAGYFIGNGWVEPTEGYAMYTIFTYYVKYQNEGGQQPPTMTRGIWDGHSGYWDWTQMQFTTLPDEVTLYWAQTPLYYSPDGWWFRFQTCPWPGQETETQRGPTVYE